MVKGFFFFAALAAIATLAQAATMEDEVRAVVDRYIAVQNAHDLKSRRSLLADSPDLLWISRGKPIWGREAALKSLEERYRGTWRIDVDRKSCESFRSAGAWRRSTRRRNSPSEIQASTPPRLVFTSTW